MNMRFISAQGAWRMAHGVFFPLTLLAWFFLMTPWGTFPDPDAFYHAHITKLMLDHGPLLGFPWLDLTTLGAQFADHHYLFHLILGPAIALFGEFWGTQLMAPLLATATALALWNVLRRMGVPYAWIFVSLALLSPNFTQRMLLGKASPLAVGLYIVIIGAYLFRKPLLMFASAMLFALGHGGWILSVLVVGLMSLGSVLNDRILHGAPWKDAWKNIPWKTIIALPLGIAAGLLLHPNRVEILRFLWVQVVKVSLFSNGTVLNQGREWNPSTFGNIVQDSAPLVIAGLMILAGLLFARRTTSDGGVPHNANRITQTASPSIRYAILLALPVALTLAMALNSQRHIEYLVPSLALWLGSLAVLIDKERFAAWFRELRSRVIQRRMLTLIPVLLAVLIVHHAVSAWSALHADHFHFDAFRNTMVAISERAQPGDRVFHSNWDEFPMLWAADDRLTFLFGLDPAFLYAKNPDLSKAQYALVTGQASSTLYAVIADKTHSRFVFVTTVRFPNFDRLLTEDTRFRELSRDGISATFEVVGDGMDSSIPSKKSGNRSE